MYFYIEINCPSLDDPLNGDVEVITDNNGTMSSVYTCDQGYRLVGYAVRTCQADGTWTGTEPTCTCERLCSMTASYPITYFHPLLALLLEDA